MGDAGRAGRKGLKAPAAGRWRFILASIRLLILVARPLPSPTIAAARIRLSSSKLPRTLECIQGPFDPCRGGNRIKNPPLGRTVRCCRSCSAYCGEADSQIGSPILAINAMLEYILSHRPSKEMAPANINRPVRGEDHERTPR